MDSSGKAINQGRGNLSPLSDLPPWPRLTVRRESHFSDLHEIYFSRFAISSDSSCASRAVSEGLGSRDRCRRPWPPPWGCRPPPWGLAVRPSGRPGVRGKVVRPSDLNGRT
jgi:hypothetical protein